MQDDAADDELGRPAKRQRTSPRPVAIILDIEGTVAPISFVSEVLFPYARKHVRGFLEMHYDDDEGFEDIEAIREQVGCCHLLMPP